MKSTPRPVDREIARFRAIVRDSANNLLIADGPVNADAALLDLCAEALHLLRQAEKTQAEAYALFHDGRPWDDARREESNRLGEERERFVKKPSRCCRKSASCAPPLAAASTPRRWLCDHQ